MTKTRSAAAAPAVLLALIAGCTSPQEYQERRRAAQEERQEQYVNFLAGRCLSEGFRPQDGSMFETCLRRQHSECERAKASAQLEFSTALLASNRPGSTFNRNAAAASRSVDTSRLCPPRS